MKNIYAFCFVALLLVSLITAQASGSGAQPSTGQSQDIQAVSGMFLINQSGDKGENITVTIIVPLLNRTSISQQQRDEADKILRDVRAMCDQQSYPNNIYHTKDECIVAQSQQRLGAASVFYRSIENATIGFAIYNPTSANYEPIVDCGGANGLKASGPGVQNDQYGTLIYQVNCKVPDSLYRGIKTKVLITYLDNNQPVLIKNETDQYQSYIVSVEPRAIEISDVSVNLIDVLYTQITESIRAAANKQPTACLGLSVILGLLLASMYFSGKSPMSLLDITTPRLPSPKGLTASGQILLPYGYQEMKKAAAGKLAAAGVALKATVDRLSQNYQYSSDWRKAKADIDKLNAPPEQRRVLEALALHAFSSGKKYSDIKHLLSKLPSKYGDKEHQTVASILAAMTAQGGASAHTAAVIKDVLLTQRMLDGMSYLGGTPSSKIGKKIVGFVNTAVGPNRYNNISTAITGGIGSIIRTGRTMKSVTKEMVKTAPELARGTARAVIETISPTAMARIKSTAAGEGAAARLAKQLVTPPSAGMEVGKKVRIDEKMARHYEQLLNETKSNVVVYLLKQGYKALGVNFALTEKDILEFALKDIDILEKSGYAKNAARIQAMEKELASILTGKISIDEKISQLTALVQKYGARIDPEMFKFLDRLNAIDRMYGKEDGYLKFIALHEFLAQHEKLAAAAGVNQANTSDRFYSVLGRNSINGSDIWETMVLRTMLWDGENGYLKGGLKEGLQRAWLDSINRLIGLNPTSNIKELPEFMRNENELRKIEARIRYTICDLMTPEGRGWFMKQYGKPPEKANIKELLEMLYGEKRLPPDSERLKGDRLGRMVFWEDQKAIGPAAEWFKVDMKRHWIGALDPRENFAIGQWVESRFTRSNVPPLKPSIEAELDRMPGSKGWSVEQRTREAKKLWVIDNMKQDYEQRFNSQFCQDAYGKLPERAAFYYGVLLGFYEKAIKDKVVLDNHPDLFFVKNMNANDPTDLKKFRNDIALRYKNEFINEMKNPVTFNDILNSPRALVQLYEGDYAYYRKGMALSIADKVYGEVALRDNKGRWNKFVAEDVVIDFTKYGRADLQAEYQRLTRSKVQPGADWDNYMENVRKWAREGGYNYEKEKIYAALVSSYGRNTLDYMKYWRDTGLEVKPVKETTEIAPQILRMFGVENEKAKIANTLFRNLRYEFGSYFVKTTLAGSRQVVDALYDSVITSEYLKEHSLRMSMNWIANVHKIRDMSAPEISAYNEVARAHWAFHQAWAWAIDRSIRTTPSQGLIQVTEHAFHHGPGHILGSIKDYVRATMTGPEYAMFYAFYGWPMDLAAKLHRPYVNMFRSIQTAMQGYPSRWDVNQADALKPFEYTDARPLEALRSVSNILGTGKLSKLKVWESATDYKHLSGDEIMKGLRQAPQDIYYRRSGVDSIARTGMANPGVSYHNYRYELQLDEAAASYLWRTRDAVYLFDKEIEQQAHRSTVRRTVAAEALAMKYDQEIRGFGVLQNAVYGWFNPLLFAWHTPLPLWPTSWTIRDVATRFAARRHGYEQEPWSARVEQLAADLGAAAYRAATPWKGTSVVYCPKCGRPGYRGTVCRSCSTTLYAGKLPEHAQYKKAA